MLKRNVSLFIGGYLDCWVSTTCILVKKNIFSYTRPAFIPFCVLFGYLLFCFNIFAEKEGKIEVQVYNSASNKII